MYKSNGRIKHSLRLLSLGLMIFLVWRPAQVPPTPGTFNDLTVSDAEISAAKTRMGDSFVGIVISNLSAEYHSSVGLGVTGQLAKYGIKSQVLDAHADAAQEVTAIQSFLKQGAKALVVPDFNSEVITAILEPTIKAGIPVVQYAGRTLAGIGAVTVGVENAELGAAAGQYAGTLIAQELKGIAKVAILDYPSIPEIVARADNIETALKKEAPDVQIVGRFLGGTFDNGQKSMEAILKAAPDVNVLVSINDAGALGAITTLVADGKKPRDVLVVGIDAEKEAELNILDEYFFRGSVDTQPDLTGTMLGRAVIKLLANSDFPHNIVVPVKLVTKDTILHPDATAQATAVATLSVTSTP